MSRSSTLPRASIPSRNPPTRPSAACCRSRRPSASASRTASIRRAARKANRSCGCRSRTPRALIKGDAAGEIATDGQWTEATREAFADRIEAILASHIDRFAESVLARKAYSPVDLESMNINLVGGDPYGGSCALDQFFIWRPFAGSVNNSTAIANLHHIGASTHPGPDLAAVLASCWPRGWADERDQTTRQRQIRTAASDWARSACPISRPT
jgi:hypothetical protein